MERTGCQSHLHSATNVPYRETMGNLWLRETRHLIGEPSSGLWPVGHGSCGRKNQCLVWLRSEGVFWRLPLGSGCKAARGNLVSSLRSIARRPFDQVWYDKYLRWGCTRKSVQLASAARSQRAVRSGQLDEILAATAVFQQGLVNVPFWEYWTSPYSSHYRPYT